MAALLAKVAEAAQAAREAGQRAEAAARARDAAIVAAWQAGAGVREIAQAAGLSHQRVSQIIGQS